jgi:hypothetical protein
MIVLGIFPYFTVNPNNLKVIIVFNYYLWFSIIFEKVSGDFPTHHVGMNSESRLYPERSAGCHSGI